MKRANIGKNKTKIQEEKLTSEFQRKLWMFTTKDTPGHKKIYKCQLKSDNVDAQKKCKEEY